MLKKALVSACFAMTLIGCSSVKILTEEDRNRFQKVDDGDSQRLSEDVVLGIGIRGNGQIEFFVAEGQEAEMISRKALIERLSEKEVKVLNFDSVLLLGWEGSHCWWTGGSEGSGVKVCPSH